MQAQEEGQPEGAAYAGATGAAAGAPTAGGIKGTGGAGSGAGSGAGAGGASSGGAGAGAGGVGGSSGVSGGAWGKQVGAEGLTKRLVGPGTGIQVSATVAPRTMPRSCAVCTLRKRSMARFSTCRPPSAYAGAGGRPGEDSAQFLSKRNPHFHWFCSLLPQEPEGDLEKTVRSPVAEHVLEPQME